MDTRTATAKRAMDARIAAGVSLEDLAAASGIPYTTLHRKLNAKSPFTVEEIALVATALQVDPKSLVEFPESPVHPLEDVAA